MVSDNRGVSHSEPMMTIDSAALASNAVPFRNKVEGTPACRHIRSRMDITMILSSGSGDGGEPRAK